MPWNTPTLREVRGLVRDSLRASLPGADASVPNSVLRVLSDNQGALCHLTLQYIDWLALQLLPDTAEHEWLDRHGEIWLVGPGGTVGRKVATPAVGLAEFEGPAGTVVPINTQLSSGGGIGYELTATVTIGTIPTKGPIRALDPGTASNLVTGTPLTVANVPAVTGATVTELYGGTDEETDDQLRARVLHRIRLPPQGGAAHDYVQWALATPGCTRAWVYPNEMGMGTVTVRVMFDDVRADNGGFPFLVDLGAVESYIDIMRPVAVKDFWVLAPIPQRVDFIINQLTPNDDSTKAGIKQSIEAMMWERAAPGQTIFASWKYAAVQEAPSVISFSTPDFKDDLMPTPGHMAVLGDIVFGT